MRILLTIEYFGKNYAGWQRQKNATSVQQVLEEKLSLILQSPIVLSASGRTDSGVHALGQKAHFDYEGNFPVGKMAFAVNTTLPEDIRVLSAIKVSDDFHAQYSAKRKTYVYKMYVSRTLHPLKNYHFARIPYDKVDFDKMERACEDLIGTHDFSGFSSTGSGIKTTVRTIYSATLRKDGEDITLEITGNGFLYNMVRIIAGTLAYIGAGLLPEDSVKIVLDTKNRKLAGKTFPPQGLYLKEVFYEDENKVSEER